MKKKGRDSSRRTHVSREVITNNNESCAIELNLLPFIGTFVEQKIQIQYEMQVEGQAFMTIPSTGSGL